MVWVGALAQAQLVMSHCYRNPDSASVLIMGKGKSLEIHTIVEWGLFCMGSWIGSHDWCYLKPLPRKTKENKFKCMKLSFSS